MTGSEVTRIPAVHCFPDTGERVRVIAIDGEPWFVASDVCGILGHTNTGKAVRVLDEDERQTLSLRRSEGVTTGSTFTDQRVNSVTVVSEPGLYSLIMRSKLPAAKQFRRWVTHEVLPSLRQTGSYSASRNRHLYRMARKRCSTSRPDNPRPPASRNRGGPDAPQGRVIRNAQEGMKL